MTAKRVRAKLFSFVYTSSPQDFYHLLENTVFTVLETRMSMVRPLFFIASTLMLLLSTLLTSVFAEDDTSNAEKTATAKTSEFQPGEISIGEPLQVPFQKPKVVVPPPAVPAKSSDSEELDRPSNQDAHDTDEIKVKSLSKASGDTSRSGTGWLGVTVDDSVVPGRLVVVDVASGGPAALAGVTPQDILVGINGSPLKTSDEMAAVLATIVPGMTVKMAIGKGESVKDLELKATKRPRKIIPDTNDPVLTESLASNPNSDTSPPLPSVNLPPAVPSSAAVSPTLPLPASAPEAPTTPPAPASMLPAPVPAPVPMNMKNNSSGRVALGVRTVPVDMAVQARYRLPAASGAYVIGVVANLPASMAGVPPGSVIVAIRNQPVRNPLDLTRLVTSGPVGAPVPLQYVLPGGESRQADVVLQSIEAPLERALVGETAKETFEDFREAERKMTPPSTRPALEQDALSTVREEIRELHDHIEQLERRIERLEPTILR